MANLKDTNRAQATKDEPSNSGTSTSNAQDTSTDSTQGPKTPLQAQLSSGNPQTGSSPTKMKLPSMPPQSQQQALPPQSQPQNVQSQPQQQEVLPQSQQQQAGSPPRGVVFNAYGGEQNNNTGSGTQFNGDHTNSSFGDGQ